MIPWANSCKLVNGDTQSVAHTCLCGPWDTSPAPLGQTECLCFTHSTKQNTQPHHAKRCKTANLTRLCQDGEAMNCSLRYCSTTVTFSGLNWCQPRNWEDLVRASSQAFLPSSWCSPCPTSRSIFKLSYQGSLAMSCHPWSIIHFLWSMILEPYPMAAEKCPNSKHWENSNSVQISLQHIFVLRDFPSLVSLSAFHLRLGQSHVPNAFSGHLDVSQWVKDEQKNTCVDRACRRWNRVATPDSGPSMGKSRRTKNTWNPE